MLLHEGQGLRSLYQPNRTLDAKSFLTLTLSPFFSLIGLILITLP